MRKLVSWKKLILLALCVCMVVTLVACANTGNNSGNGGVETPAYTDHGAVAKNPSESISKIVSAIFAEENKDKYLKAGFNGDFKLDVGKNNVVNVNMDVRANVNINDSANSQFSVVINTKGKENVNPKLLWGAYFDGNLLEIDNRGIGGKFTEVDTDIVYLVNLLIDKFNGNSSPQAKAGGLDMDKLQNMIPKLVGAMVDSGVLQVYEKYVEETNSTQITISLYIREFIKYVQTTLLSMKDGALGSILPDAVVDNVVKVLNKIYNLAPVNSALNIGVGVKGSTNHYELVNGSFKYDGNLIDVSFIGSEVVFNKTPGSVQSPVNKPADYAEIDRAKLGGFGMDISLGIDLSEGDISIADIDHALGGILDRLVNDLYANDQDRSKIDFSRNYIHVLNNTGVDIRLGASFQLDVKDNNKTNLLLEIYFDDLHNGKQGACDPGEALLQVYYIGEDQAFYLDLTGLGKTNTLPNKLKISKDANGNPINLTNLFTEQFLDLIIVDGKLDFKPLINMVQNLMKPEGAPAAATADEVDALNDKMLDASLPLVLDQQGNAQPDVMKIVQIILHELNFDKNEAEILSGISVTITSRMFKDIFREALVGKDIGDIAIFDEAYVGLHVDLADGLMLDVRAELDANDYDAGEVKGFPVVKLGIHARIAPFEAFDESRFPKDRYGVEVNGKFVPSEWQDLQIVEKYNTNGAIDLLGSLFATLQNKKVYLSASANLNLKVDGTNGAVPLGAELNQSIGGALGAALADLQLLTGEKDVNYTLTLTANINLASFVGLDFNTTPIMQVLERIIGDQEIMINLKDQTANKDILAILLAGGKVYVDAVPLGIPKAVIDLQYIFDLFPEPATQSYADTQAEQADPNATKKLIVILLSNIDALTVMQDEVAISLNAAFLNVLIPMLMPGTTMDATLNQLGASIKFDQKDGSPFYVDEVNKSLLNQLSINVGFATDIAGINIAAGVAVGGINIGLVDTSTDAKYRIETVFFANRNRSEFNNPFGNTLVNIGLQGKLKLTGDGEFTLSNEKGDNKLNGEFGAILNTLALAIGMENVNKELTLTLEAALDLKNKFDNKSQIALQITSTTNGIEEVVVGVYVYNKSVYVNIPLLIDPFKLDFDVAGFVFGLINGDIVLGGNTDNSGNTPATPDGSGAVTTANVGGNEIEAFTSLVELTEKAANVRLSSNMLKGIIVTLIGNMTTAPQGEQPKLDPQVGDELIEMIHTLPFDLLVLGSLNYGGDKGLLQDLNVDLNVYLGKNVLADYQAGKDLKSPQPGTIGLGVNLGNIKIGFEDASLFVIDAIKTALQSNEFDFVASIDSITNADLGKILKDTKLSVQTDISLRLSSRGELIEGTDQNGNDITIDLQKVFGSIGEIPKLLIRLASTPDKSLDKQIKDFINLQIHLAASIDAGKLIAGDFNSAISLSLGIYRGVGDSNLLYKTDGSFNYEANQNNKIVSIVALPETFNGKTTLTAYIDAVGFGKTDGGKILSGQIKLQKLDLNTLIASAGAGATAGETTPPEDHATVVTKVSGIVTIINDVISKITITNEALSLDLGANILSLVLGLITKQDGTANSEVLPLTSGDISIVLKDTTINEVAYKPGIYAKVGLRERGQQEPTVQLGIGLSNLHLSFSKKGGSFLYGSNFDASKFAALSELPEVSLNANLAVDVDLKDGVHNLNLLNIYNSFIGNTSALMNTQEGLEFVNSANLMGLHLGLGVHGVIGIKDYTKTFIHIRIKAYQSKQARLDDLATFEEDTNGKLFLDAYLYKDNLYLNSDILNINAFKVPNLGFSKFISDKIRPILAGLAAGQSDYALSTAEDNLSMLLGDRTMEIAVGKVFLQELLPLLVTSVPAEALENIIDILFGGLKLDLNLNTMSASINLELLKNQAMQDIVKPGENMPDVSHLLDFTISLNGLEVSALPDKFGAKDGFDIHEEKYEEAVDNAFAELGASVILNREPVTTQTNGDPKNLDNIFGELAGIIDGIGSIDKSLRDTLNGVIQSLYIDIMSNPEFADNGHNIKLNVLLQVNLNWKSWQALDLHDSSFRLKISSNKIGGETATILDAYLIGNTGLTGALYIEAPLLGVDSDGNSLTKLKINGINLIEIIEASQNQQSAPTVSATGTADDTIASVLKIVEGVIGKIEFTKEGFQIGLAEKALTAVASALGLVPSLDAGLVDAVGSVIGALPDTDTSSGIYIKYPTKDGSLDATNRTSPEIGLRYGLVGVGKVDIQLNHYAVGVVNNFDNYVAVPIGSVVPDGKRNINELPFIDVDGLKKLQHFTTDNEYQDIAKLQNIQVRVKGSLSAGFNSADNTDLSELVQNVLGSILGLAPLQELGMKLESDLNNSSQALLFEVAANIDLSAVLDKLQLDLTIFNSNVKKHSKPNEVDNKDKQDNILVRVFYGNNTLYVQSPKYLNDIMRIEHVDSLFASLGASAQAEGDTTTVQRLATLQLVFGTNSLGLNITGGVFSILLQMLQGQGMDLSDTMFDSLKDNFGVGIELGSIQSDGDGKIYLPDLYAALNIKMGPIGLGLKLEQPEIQVATKNSLMPADWDKTSKHYKDVVFRVKASGRIGLEAEYTKLDLNALLKGFGVNKALDFDAILGDPNDPNHNPLNLHLGLELDAELCLGDFNNCMIRLTVNAYKNAQKFSIEAPKAEDFVGELLSVYIVNSTVYLDLDNDIISLGTIYVNKIAMEGIMDAINKPMTTDANAPAPQASNALATAPAEDNVTNEENIFLSNLIKLSFNSAVNKQNQKINELGSISAEIGAGVINKIFAMLGLDALTDSKLAAVVKIDIPSSETKFGVGLNVSTPSANPSNPSENSSLINGLGLYVWLGDFEFVEKVKLANGTIDYEDHPAPTPELAIEAMDLGQLMNKYVHVGLEANLSMMRSETIKATQDNNNPSGARPNDKGNGIIMDKLLTEFFSNVVPWMPDFLAQLEVLGGGNDAAAVENFYTSHSIRLQANVNIGMLINHKTCMRCGKDFTGSEPAFTKDHVCPHCGAPLDKIRDREFYLDEIDVAVEVLRNEKTGGINSDSSATVTTTPVVLMGIYVEDSEIKFYGEPFGLNNFTISKQSVESIAKTVTSLIGGAASVAETNALSTYSLAYATAGEQNAPAEEQALDIVGLLNNLIRSITISMYSIRVGIADNILSYVPQLTKMLGIDGFPEYGYPSINENNYIEIGLIKNEKIDLGLTLNFDMFGVNTAIALKGIDLHLGEKQKLTPSVKFTPDVELNNTDSIINLNVEAEVRLNINEANGKLTDLIGGLLGDLEAGYIVDKTIGKDFLLRIRGQVDIADYSVVLGVELLEQFDNDNDGKIDLVTPGSTDCVNTVLGLYYDSNVGTAYLESGILSNLKITGIELSDLLGRLTSEDAMAMAAVAGIRPILNRDIFDQNTENPAVKVTIALQQYVAVAISSELINQVINGIDVMNKIPILPDYEIGVKIGRELKPNVPVKPEGNPSTDYNPFAITLQVGLGSNPGRESGFLIDLAAKIYLGPINNPSTTLNTTTTVGGTYINVINKDEANKANGPYQIITDDMRKYPEVLHLKFDTEGYLDPEVVAEELKVSLSIDLLLGMNKGTNNFGYIFENVFGNNAEITALAKVLDKKQLNLRIGLEAQINTKNLLFPLITKGEPTLKDTRIKLAVKNLDKPINQEKTDYEELFELTLVGGGKGEKDNIYIRIKDFDELNGDKKDFKIVVDTINILELVESLQPQAASALSTASDKTALTNFVNTLIKDIHITGDNNTEYIRANINFTSNILDNVIKLLPILLADMNNATIDQVLAVVQQINLPTISGGLYLRFKQNNKAVANGGVGIGLGLDITIDNMTRVAFGIDIAGVEVLDKSKTDYTSKVVKPTDDEKTYTSIKNLKLNLGFEGYVEASNENTNAPISMGALITTVLGLLNVNLGGDVDFNVNIRNTEKYGLKLEGFVDMQDFALVEKDGKFVTRDPKTSKIKLTLTKANMVGKKDNPDRELLAVYLDFNSKAIYADLTGMNLPKLKLTGLDLAQMLGDVISPYVGGKAQVAPATAQANEANNLQTNKLAALLYMTVSPEMAQLRFNADLINGLLQLLLGLVLQMTNENDPNYAIVNQLQGLSLPEFGTIEITAKDLFNDNVTENTPANDFDIRIYRTANVRDNNYLALGVKHTTISTRLLNGDSLFTVGVGTGTVDTNTYPTIFDMTSGQLAIEEIAIDAELNLNLDFTKRGAKDYSFARYISRLLAILIDGKDTPENIEKYQVAIVGSGSLDADDPTRILQYKLTIRGVLNITDIFGKSNLAVELWKMDMVNAGDKGVVTNPANYDRNTQSTNHIMLLGAYLKTDTTNNLPSLYLDLNNLGLPRIKLVGIDSMFGGAVSQSVDNGALGTGVTTLDDVIDVVHNNITVSDDYLSIGLNRGFLYGVLQMLMPDMFQDGQIVAGGMKLPLPKIKGVQVGIDFSKGLSALDLRAFLEEDSTSYLGINLKLNDIQLGDAQADKNKPGLSYGDFKQVNVSSDFKNWDNICNKVELKDGKAIQGEKYLGTFGSVHIGTSFMSDMLNSIIDSVDPSLIIDYQKRGNSKIANWQNGDLKAPTTTYNRASNAKQWVDARVGQSWNQVYLERHAGTNAQDLKINVKAMSGSNDRKDLGTPEYSQEIPITLDKAGQLHLNLTKVIRSASALGKLPGLDTLLTNLTIDITSGAGSLGNMIMPGQSALSTADEAYDPFSIFNGLEISSLIKGISLRIYTAAPASKGTTAPKTVVQVKVDPELIDNAFAAVNLLLCGVFDSSIKTNPTWRPDYIKKTPSAIIDCLEVMIKGMLGNPLGIVDDLLDGGLLGNGTDLLNALAALLPLPVLNLKPDQRFTMQTTNDTDGNATELVRSELNITLNYDLEKVKVIGALESIRAEFGNDYAFSKANIGLAYDNSQFKNPSFDAPGQNLDEKTKNAVAMAADAAKNGLGYVLLNIGAAVSKPIGFKAVDKVTSYDRGGVDSLKTNASSYLPTNAPAMVEGNKAAKITISIPESNKLFNEEKYKEYITEEIKKYIRDNNLPMSANVAYTYTGADPVSAQNVSIVWDDSRININQNGSSPSEDGKDNYLYGWVQNVLIAKIPVEISGLQEFKSIKVDNDPNKAVTIEMVDPSIQKIDILADGYANLKITLDSYITKDLPNAITFIQGSNNKEKTYTTTAVKRIVYRSTEPGLIKEYNTETDENLTQIWDNTLETPRFVNVVKVGWQGDWYYSKSTKIEVAGKLEWDTTNLPWSVSNPYMPNNDIGGNVKTVKMKLTTGKFDVFELDKIKVNVKNYITTEQVISAINKLFNKNGNKQIDVNIMETPEFINVLKGISQHKKDSVSTSNVGDGLMINVNGKNLFIKPDEIVFDLKPLENWLKDTNNNKYKGGIIKVPVTITRDVTNSKEASGKESIKFQFDLTINIEGMELLDAKFVDETKTNFGAIYNEINIALNPYMSFEEQIVKLFNYKKETLHKQPSVMMSFRLKDGSVKQIVLPIIINPEEGAEGHDLTYNNDSLKMNGNARVKIDIASMYGAYGANEAKLDVRVLAGDSSFGLDNYVPSKHDYIETFIPVNISKASINRNDLNIDITGVNNNNTVNALRADSLSNIDAKDPANDRALKVQIPVRIGSTTENRIFDIVWFDEQAILNASKTGAENVVIDAVIGYMQPGSVVRNIAGESRQNLNNYLNKRVKLKIAKVDRVDKMTLVSFNGVRLKYNRLTGEYILPANVNVNQGELKYSYVDGSGQLQTMSVRVDETNPDSAIKQVKLNMDIHSKKTTISIGLFNFTVVSEETVTAITNIYVNGVERAFTIDETGAFVVKYGFNEALPVDKDGKIKVTIKFVVPQLDQGAIQKDAEGNIIVDKTQTKEIVLVRSATNPKLYELATSYGPYDFTVKVTK